MLGQTRVTPNQIGFVSMIVGLGFIGCLFKGVNTADTTIVSVLLFLRILLDCTDGQLARLANQTSSLGALYDLVQVSRYAAGAEPVLFLLPD